MIELVGYGDTSSWTCRVVWNLNDYGFNSLTENRDCDHTGDSAVIISSHSDVKIGKHYSIGGIVQIYDHDFHDLDADVSHGTSAFDDCTTKPITIRDNVFIGTQNIILKGVNISARASIGDGSVVTNDLSTDSITAGSAEVVVKGTES